MLGAKTNQKLSKSYFSSKEEKNYSLKTINSLGLAEKINEPVRRLSGGQQRRVAIARTLSQAPSLIMADEFLSELDEKTINIVLREILDYVKNSKAALLVVEHDVSRAREMADHLLVIDDGRVNPFISETRTILLEAEK
jgi:ABC-type phosphate/phosphonate transport system ATPase subunit